MSLQSFVHEVPWEYGDQIIISNSCHVPKTIPKLRLQGIRVCYPAEKCHFCQGLSLYMVSMYNNAVHANIINALIHPYQAGTLSSKDQWSSSGAQMCTNGMVVVNTVALCVLTPLCHKKHKVVTLYPFFCPQSLIDINTEEKVTAILTDRYVFYIPYACRLLLAARALRKGCSPKMKTAKSK